MKNIFKLVLPLLLAFLILGGFSYWRLRQGWESERKSIAMQLVETVEAFKDTHHRLPEESELELMSSEVGPIYYLETG